MKIDKTTMLFYELTPYESDELIELAERVVQKGECIILHPLFLKWTKACSLTDVRSQLLVMSTLFPQKALLSVIKNNK